MPLKSQRWVSGLAIATLALAGIAAAPTTASAAPKSVTLTGDLQTELGCAADWDPTCTATDLEPTGAAGVYAGEFTLPAGTYDYKVAIDHTWDGDTAVGLDGGDGNIPLTIGGTTRLRFSYDTSANRVSVQPLDLRAGYTDADADLVHAPVREAGSDNQYYFVMTDRFDNGDTSNDDGGLTGDRMSTGFDPTDQGFYHGGDLEGLDSKLGYIKGLGTTAIWLTPSFKNKPVQGTGKDASAGYHGYWVTDFTRIDPHLGTNAQLKKVIADAHAKGMKVYFDIITNHTADVISNKQGSYDYVSQAEKPYVTSSGTTIKDIEDYAGSKDFPSFDADSFPLTPTVPDDEKNLKVPSWLNDVTLYHNRGNTTNSGESTTLGDVSGLDDLMTENPEVVDGMVSIYENWIDLGIDGFRIDTVKDVDFPFWKQWTKPVMDYARAKGKKDFFMFGEVYDSDPKVTSPYVRKTDMSSVLDFPFQAAATNFAKGYTTKGLSTLFAGDDRYTTPHSDAGALPTFLGNHDMGRIGYFLAGSDHTLKRDELANELMFFTRGQPIVYYGDEQGFAGTGGDKAARQDMFGTKVASYADQPLVDGTTMGDGAHFDTDSTLYRFISALSSLRSGDAALRNGAQIQRYADDGPGVYAFSRVDSTEKVENLVALNNATSAKKVTFTTLTPNAHYSVLYGDTDAVTAGADGSVTLTVPALGAVVLKADRKVAAPSTAQAISVAAPTAGAGLSGTTPISATVDANTWSQTSFSYRVAGSDAWVPLGTSETTSPRVYADVSGLAKGTLVEYRAVTVDAAGHRSAASTYASVGNAVDGAVAAPPVDDSTLVTVPGTENPAQGCASAWDPSCAQAALTKRSDGIYSGTFTLPKGDYQFKVAVGGTWDENYGAGGVANGDNISFSTDGGPVTFYYDPATHYAMTDAMGPVITLAGSFQKQLGCSDDWKPDCLGAWLEDPDGDGTYTYTTTALATGSYQVKVAYDLGWDENYGAGGVANGANIDFSATSGKAVTFSYDAATHKLTVAVDDPPLAGTGTQMAQWIDADTIAWPTSLLPDGTTAKDESWALYASPTAQVKQKDGAVTGANPIELKRDPRGLPKAQLKRFPALATGYIALHPDSLSRSATEEILRDQIVVAQFGHDGTATAYTGVQPAGVLDDLYAPASSEHALGVTWKHGAPSTALWAPTARTVTLLLDPADGTGVPRRIPATRRADGRWTVRGSASWVGRSYRYEVVVYVPQTDSIETNTVTDPYSVALTTDSTRSVFVDLDDPAYRPAVWRSTPSPVVANEDARTIYELHVRDFSIDDKTVPAALRGTYDAFTVDSAGMKHLRSLASAGLNTVQLQPAFDFSSVEEDKSAQAKPACDLASYGPASEKQQACIAKTADSDAYNWGYDPYHFMTPEGSYAVHPDGGTRDAEFRKMVGALHASGLQVVLDQVYNHTSASGQSATSVLDKVVPEYYHRLDAKGAVETGTCCQDVATEHAMAQKLMVDSVVSWAKNYHVDGFRFDLMGFHSVATMKAVRDALDKLTKRRDGVDGRRIALYGEGWNFGEVADNALFTQATQGQLGGTGIGTFNDRLRDAVRGGSPVDASSIQTQGYGSGVSTDPNGAASNGSAADQKAALAHDEDLVKLGLAGNLRDYSFTTSDGTVKKGSQIDYNGQPAGYADQPDETVNYVDAHDNRTLFDALTLKLPRSTSMADRIRMQTLSLATATLSQSPSMWLAGTDMLRSKSLDGNSYNSGDWFNEIDWSGQSNGFGKGLPQKADNGGQWSVMTPLLADASLKPTPAQIAAASAQAATLLRLKASTPLFSLGSASAIEKKLTFPTTSTPGVIAMRIDDTVGSDVDPDLDGLLVVFNAGTTKATETIPALKGAKLELAPEQKNGPDAVVASTAWASGSGTVTVPARTVAVLEQPQKHTDGSGHSGGSHRNGGSHGNGGSHRNGGGTSHHRSAGGGASHPHAAQKLSLRLSRSVVRAGDPVHLSASGFEPGRRVMVWLHSTPTLLAGLPTGTDGAISVTVQIPADTPVGEHHVELTTASGARVSAPLLVMPAGVPGTLAVTGVEVAPWLLGALALLLAGGAFLFVARRRSRRRAAADN